MTFSEFLLFIPCTLAVSFILFALPIFEYIFARLFIKRWPVRCLRYWAMSGINLKKLPSFCSFPCDGSCKNWTCPNYYKN